MASSQQQSGSATTPPSEKRKTEYLILTRSGPGDADYGTYEVIVALVFAWSPASALEVAKERAPELEQAEQLVVVPASSWHVFKPAVKTETVFERQLAEPTGA